MHGPIRISFTYLLRRWISRIFIDRGKVLVKWTEENERICLRLVQSYWRTLFIALMLHSLRVMDLICFIEFPFTLFASNISGFKLTLLSRVLKWLRVCCVRLKGVDILTEVFVVFYADEILLEIRHSLWKNGIWNRENVEVLLNFIRSKFNVASKEKMHVLVVWKFSHSKGKFSEILS